MKIEITGKGIYGADGEVPIGTTLEVKEEPKGWEGRYRVVSGEAKDKGTKTPVTNPAKKEFKAPFEAKDKGNGWWAVFDADGQEVKALRKDDAETFNVLSDADKAVQVENFRKEA